LRQGDRRSSGDGVITETTDLAFETKQMSKAELVAALKKYGKHEPLSGMSDSRTGCASNEMPGISGKRKECTCGLDKIIQAAEADLREDESRQP
jgi:hypothetical protein